MDISSSREVELAALPELAPQMPVHSGRWAPTLLLQSRTCICVSPSPQPHPPKPALFVKHTEYTAQPIVSALYHRWLQGRRCWPLPGAAGRRLSMPSRTCKITLRGLAVARVVLQLFVGLATRQPRLSFERELSRWPFGHRGACFRCPTCDRVYLPSVRGLQRARIRWRARPPLPATTATATATATVPLRQLALSPALLPAHPALVPILSPCSWVSALWFSIHDLLDPAAHG